MCRSLSCTLDFSSRRTRDSCAHELLSGAFGANDILSVGDEALASHRYATRTAEEALQGGKGGVFVPNSGSMMISPSPNESQYSE